MTESAAIELLPPALARAMQSQGYEELTAIQQALLEPGLTDHDLRLSSQTGSGKTVAIGMLCASLLHDSQETSSDTKPKTKVLLVAPTRELAAQIAKELTWLYKELSARLVVVTGGTNIGGDLAKLKRAPDILVGTPGRLADHLRRRTVDLSGIQAVVLDEADEMLDMGFREELEALLDQTPASRRTHLVSATLPREVIRLADKYQDSPRHVQGTQLGSANSDIEHLCMSMRDGDKQRALTNILLMSPDEKTLVFARTRAATVQIAQRLNAGGFNAAALNGDMNQRERTATLNSFRSNNINILVATDVAARGLDIKNVTRVIHFDLPENVSALTHRSGRTGRAGQSGTSIAFQTPREARRCQEMFRRGKIKVRTETVPTPEQIKSKAAKRFAEELQNGEHPDSQMQTFARALLQDHDPETLVAKLLSKASVSGPCQPHVVQTPAAMPQNSKRKDKPPRKGKGKSRGSEPEAGFVPFYLSMGANHGASASRVLAIVCDKGNITSSDVGRIRIESFHCIVDISDETANNFEREASKSSKAHGKVTIRRWTEKSPERTKRKEHGPSKWTKNNTHTRPHPSDDARPQHSDKRKHSGAEASATHSPKAKNTSTKWIESADSESGNSHGSGKAKAKGKPKHSRDAKTKGAGKTKTKSKAKSKGKTIHKHEAKTRWKQGKRPGATGKPSVPKAKLKAKKRKAKKAARAKSAESSSQASSAL